jgi:L-rhamnose isomerase/sugar isomerase
VELVEAE